jgi:hypothetical protein
MDDPQLTKVENSVRETASEFRYPPLPDISRQVLPRLKPATLKRELRVQKLAWAAVVLFIVVVGLLATPPVRAQILEFLQVGVVRIFLEQPSETPAPTENQATPSPETSLIPYLQAIAGETTLQNVQERVPFPIRLPGFPTDLGEPDLVFLQNMAGPLVVLVWMDPQETEQVRLSLHLIGPGSYAIGKSMPHALEMAEVNGQPAVWAEGPYVLNMKNSRVENFRLIEGHVLIWEEGELTYRLETDLPLEEAVRIAESLH